LGVSDAVDNEARLSFQDVYYIHQIAGSDLRFGEWLFDLMLYAKQRKVFLSRLFLSQETLRYEFKNGKEKYRDYLQQCTDANLLEQVGKRISVGISSTPRVLAPPRREVEHRLQIPESFIALSPLRGQ